MELEPTTLTLEHENAAKMSKLLFKLGLEYLAGLFKLVFKMCAASFNFLKSASRTVNFERQELGQIMELDDVP